MQAGTKTCESKSIWQRQSHPGKSKSRSNIAQQQFNIDSIRLPCPANLQYRKLSLHRTVLVFLKSAQVLHAIPLSN
jgi:hypothetical protein